MLPFSVMRCLVLVLAVMTSSLVAAAKGRPAEITRERLAHPTTIDGIALPAATAVERSAAYDADGKLGPAILSSVRLPRAMTLCGVTVPGATDIAVRHGLAVSPYPGDTAMPVSQASHLVWTTARALVVGDRTFARGTMVAVECPSGQLTMFVAPRPVAVGDLRASFASWYPSDVGGTLSVVQLAAAASIEGIHVPAEVVVSLRPDGHIVALVDSTHAAVMIRGRVCRAGSQGDALWLRGDGRLECSEVDTHGIACDPAADILVHDGGASGRFAGCTLAKPFEGAKVGEVVRFDRDGKRCARSTGKTAFDPRTGCPR